MRATPAPTAARLRAGVAIIIVATTLAYLPSLSGGFVLDDNILLTANPLIRASDGLYRIWFTTQAIDYWPVFNTTFWVEWRLWGMDPIGYHVTNLILHIAAALLAWAILRRMAVPGAFLAGLLFALHPVNVESVAWISQCKSVLAMLFALASIYAYLRAEIPGPALSRRRLAAADRWYGLSLAAFLLAMLSKGSVAVLPLLLLIILWWLRPLTGRDLQRTAPFLLIGVVLVLVNIWFQTHGTHTVVRPAGMLDRILGAAAGVWFYLSKALLPIDLTFIYPQWHIDPRQLRWWAPLLLAITVTGVLWWYRRGWSRSLLCAWAFFCVALVPVLGFTDVAYMEHSLVADHYQHLALLGVVAFAAGGWCGWQTRARGSAGWLPTAVAVGVLTTLAALTWRQSGLYANGMTLYRATLEKNPDSWLAHNNLGGILTEAGQLPEAIDHLERAVALNPNYPDAHSNLGVALRASGRVPEAIEHYQEALRQRPAYPEAHYNLGLALADSGQLPAAIGHFEQSLRLQPDYAEAHNDLGAALARTGHVDDAIAHFQQALQLEPGFADARYNLELAIAMQQKARNGSK